MGMDRSLKGSFFHAQPQQHRVGEWVENQAKAANRLTHMRSVSGTRKARESVSINRRPDDLHSLGLPESSMGGASPVISTTTELFSIVTHVTPCRQSFTNTVVLIPNRDSHVKKTPLQQRPE